jgi:hypothetical protein
MWERKNSRLRSEGGAYALPLIDVRGMREERIGRSVMLSTTDVVVGLISDATEKRGGTPVSVLH